MFRLAQVEDVIAVRPSTLSKPYLQAIKETIETRYLDVVCLVANKVWCQQTKMSQMSINHQGAVQYKVEFELVVFQPLIDEVLHGVIKSCTRDGLWVSVGFFDDIFVPDSAFHSGSAFHVEEGVWVWNYKGDDTDQAVELFYDVGSLMRVKVTGLRYIPVPAPPELQPNGHDKVGTRERPHRPMIVEAAVNEEGLGLCDWWKEDDG